MVSPSPRRLVARLGLVIAVAGAVPVGSQTRSLPDAPGTWKAWKPVVASASTRQEQAATPALVRAFEAELVALGAILRRAPAVASPVGFSVETWGHLASARRPEVAPDLPAAAALPLSGGLTFAAFPIVEYQRNGRTVREDTGETAQQQFLVNQIGRGLIDSGSVADWGPVDHDAFLQPMPQGEIAGLPRYGDGLVVARNPAALWTPLSLRGALDLTARARRLEVDSFQQSADASTARLAVVRDPAWRATRVKEARQAAASMPDPQAFVQQIEESIRIEEATLVRDLDPAAGGKGLVEARRALRDLTDWIAGLPAADLAAAACYARGGATLRDRFRIVPSTTCHPLVRPNYGVFDRTLPRSAPQVVIITPVARCFDTANRANRDANDPSPAGCRANRALIETLDKAALRAWVR